MPQPKKTWGDHGGERRYLESLMNHKTTQQNGGPTTAAITRVEGINLGLDVHADFIMAVRIIDGQGPQPGQRFSPAKFLEWVQRQRQHAEKVYACYEAGPLGYGLYRTLTEMGVLCYVVRPRDWDQYGSKVKTDQRDAHELALGLDRYVSGNTKAFSIVRVPTPQEEQERSLSRHRQSLLRQVQRLAAQARGNALYYGHRLRPTEWWKKAAWAELEPKLPAHLARLLGSLRAIILVAEEELKKVTRAIEAAADQDLPGGVGRLTAEVLDREAGDWNRFDNRRQVSSYTGLCPREDSSGPRRFQGSINKHGNRRLRPVLVECAWRLTRSQPEYRAVKKWRGQLMDRKATKTRRKQIIVALARQFAVDWWRIRTGRVKAEELGLVLLSTEPPKQ
jgi:transposase